MQTRERLIATIRSALESAEYCRALWLGGSDATNQTDALSDIDVQAIVRDDAVQQVFAQAEQALAGLSPIARRYRVPEPSWHGHSQSFFVLRDCPPELMIDFTVVKSSSPPSSRFLEVERHGHAKVLFDKDKLIAPVPLDRPKHEEKIRARFADLRDRVPMLAPLVIKAVRRENAPEAASMYHSIVLRGLVDMLRIVYCPDRFDFGLRYLRRDLPVGQAALVEGLALPSSLRQIELHTNLALEAFESHLAQAERMWGGTPSPAS